MTPLNVGIIGLGGMGRMMLADMLVHNGFTVSVVWDRNVAACLDCQQQNPGLRIAADASELINDPSLNLVYVASPPNSHRAYFLEAIDANVPMFCEKPFGVDLDESQDLVAKIEKAGLPHIINFNHGNALGSTHIESQLKSGAMGQIVGVDAFIHLTTWPRAFQKSATWLGRREQGGFTREMLSHWLYLTRRLLGDGAITYARVIYPEDGISSETHLTAELDFNGVPLFIRVATGGAGPVGTEYTVWGDRKSYRLHSGGHISSSDGGAWMEEFTDLGDIGARDRQRTLDGVIARLNGGAINMATASDGFAVQKLIEALLASGRK